MEPSERARLLQQVLLDQRRLLHRVRGAERPVWAQLDLPAAQLKALGTIADSGPLPVGQLGTLLGVGKPAATLLVDALVRREFVARSEDPTDRRRTIVRLTERGQALMDDLRQGGRERLAGWIAQLNEDDLAALARGLQALLTIAAAEAHA